MYDADSVRQYCLSKSGASEDMPFGEGTLVFRVMGKMFALLGIDEVPPSINLKCNPERAEELRERFDAVRPGYHQNKKHWNTVTIDGSLSAPEMRAMIDHSYDLVVAGLTRRQRDELAHHSN